MVLRENKNSEHNILFQISELNVYTITHRYNTKKRRLENAKQEATESLSTWFCFYWFVVLITLGEIYVRIKSLFVYPVKTKSLIMLNQVINYINNVYTKVQNNNAHIHVENANK